MSTSVTPEVTSVDRANGRSITTHHERGAVGRALSWLESQSLLISALAIVALVSLAQLPQHFTQDTWLALVDGRYITAHGIPGHDTLFAMTHGVRWLDQQWLAQLAIYGLYQIGSLALYGLVYVALTMAGFAIAVAAGRALGASERHILWMLPVAGFLYFAGSSNVRTQGFAYPLLSITLWLLAREAPSVQGREILSGVPHPDPLGQPARLGHARGGPAMICGFVAIARDLSQGRSRNARQHVRARGLLLLIASPFCLLINPYGPAIIHYYTATIFNPAFGKVISEWQPITASMVLAIPFFALAGFSVWLMGRRGKAMSAFDQLALIALGAGAIFAVRNVAWYGLGTMILLPTTLSSVFETGTPAARRPKINFSMLGFAVAILTVTVIAVALKPASWFEHEYDSRAIARVNQLAIEQPQARIYVDNRFADWLLWHNPRLAGRIAYDIRFELLTTAQLNSLINATALPLPGHPSLLDGYRVLVLQTGGSSTARALARPGTRVVLRGKGVIVATWEAQ